MPVGHSEMNKTCKMGSIDTALSINSALCMLWQMHLMQLNKGSISTIAMSSVKLALGHWSNQMWFLTLLKPPLDFISTFTKTIQFLILCYNAN